MRRQRRRGRNRRRVVAVRGKENLGAAAAAAAAAAAIGGAFLGTGSFGCAVLDANGEAMLRCAAAWSNDRQPGAREGGRRLLALLKKLSGSPRRRRTAGPRETSRGTGSRADPREGRGRQDRADRVKNNESIAIRTKGGLGFPRVDRGGVMKVEGERRTEGVAREGGGKRNATTGSGLVFFLLLFVLYPGPSRRRMDDARE